MRISLQLKNSFKKVETFKMIDCSNVKEVVFGEYSFFDYSEKKYKEDSQNGWYYDFEDEWKRNGTFTICDCPNLECIVFKQYAFVDFAKSFTLKSIMNESRKFKCRSSSIRGISNGK